MMNAFQIKQVICIYVTMPEQVNDSLEVFESLTPDYCKKKKNPE